MRYNNRSIHLRLEFVRCVIEVGVFLFMRMTVVVSMRMLMAVSMAVSMSMPMIMIMFPPMRMHGMVPLTSLDRLPLLIRLYIPALQKIVNDQHSSGPQSLLQHARTMCHVFEMMESEPDSRDVEVLPLRSLKVGGGRVGFIEEIAVHGVDGGVGEAGVRGAFIEGGYHVGGDVDATGDGDVWAEDLGRYSISISSQDYRTIRTDSSHQSGSAGVIEEFDFFGIIAFDVGKGNADPVEARAQGFGDLGVYFGEPGFAVVGVGYGTFEIISTGKEASRKVEKTYSKYLRLAAALVDMMVVGSGAIEKFFEKVVWRTT
jgi:hypothetical protein